MSKQKFIVLQDRANNFFSEAWQVFANGEEEKKKKYDIVYRAYNFPDHLLLKVLAWLVNAKR